MSELVLRGFNPAKSYLDHGVDLILENGRRLQVKSASRFKNKANNSTYYHFAVGGWYGKKDGNRLKKRSSPVDFYIFWCVEDNQFYVIPSEIVLISGPQGGTSGFQLDVYPGSSRQRGRHEMYRDKWDQLA